MKIEILVGVFSDYGPEIVYSNTHLSELAQTRIVVSIMTALGIGEQKEHLNRFHGLFPVPGTTRFLSGCFVFPIKIPDATDMRIKNFGTQCAIILIFPFESRKMVYSKIDNMEKVLLNETKNIHTYYDITTIWADQLVKRIEYVFQTEVKAAEIFTQPVQRYYLQQLMNQLAIQLYDFVDFVAVYTRDGTFISTTVERNTPLYQMLKERMGNFIRYEYRRELPTIIFEPFLRETPKGVIMHFAVHNLVFLIYSSRKNTLLGVARLRLMNFLSENMETLQYLDWRTMARIEPRISRHEEYTSLTAERESILQLLKELAQ